MSGAVKLLLGLAAALLVHLVGSRLFPDFPRVMDVFLVVVALHALSGNTLTGLLVGMAVGLVHDTLTGGLYGLYGFADTIVGYGTARLAQRLVIQRATGVFAVVGLASVLQQVVLVGLTFLLLPDPALPRPWWALAKAVAGGFLGMVIYAVAGSLGRNYESRRRSRMSRLRLD
ncbi:MAG TPA: rod shape-determining protein MreD [Thermoanaerobaculia bacterium]|nr:rod shape-determining protein MreD [Thermoanaerobaculia bacterium]